MLRGESPLRSQDCAGRLAILGACRRARLRPHPGRGGAPTHGVQVADRTLSRVRRVVPRALGIALSTLAVACTAQHSGVDHPTGSSSGTPTRPGPSRSVDAGPSGMHGQLITRVIPGRSSGFPARAALVYLPPVLRQAPQTRLPVLLLLHGTPGGPGDWVQGGGLARTMDAFAAVHGGRAPLVVMPDINGARGADTECVD